MQQINEVQRCPSPTVTPQALAWKGGELWMSSRDFGTFFRIDAGEWKVAEELDPPGVVWGAVATNAGWRLTIGKGLNDDRFVYRYQAGEGFRKLFACPDFTGSYLSFDGEHLYLSQWYKGEIHQLDDRGKISRTINVGAEICGHTFADGELYVLRGKENNDVAGKAEKWSIARVNLAAEKTEVEDLARVPFASRSLAFDGENFWSNHRAANETVQFALPL